MGRADARDALKLLRLTTAYPSYLRQFYGKRPSLRNAPYAVQLEQMNADAFGWADFWASALTPLGYEVRDITANAKFLQMAWAAEHGLAPGAEHWLLEIAAAQVRSFAPDVLFMDDFASFSAGWVRQMRAECPSIRLVLGWCGAPYDDAAVFGAYDAVLSCIPELVEDFRSKGLNAYHLDHAFHPRVAQQVPETERDVDMSFIGQLVPGKHAHLERLEILTALSKQINVRIHSPQAWSLFDLQEGAIPYAIKSLIRVPWYHAFWTLHRAGVPVERIPFFRRPLAWPVRPRLLSIPRSPIRGMKPALYGLDMFALLGRSKLTFNSHIDLSRYSASNMRLFEATGMGACLVTDWKPNLRELFEPDVEVATYRSAAECIEKTRWLLEHPRDAARIAAAGHRRTLSSHTFAHRAPLLDDLVRRQLR